MGQFEDLIQAARDGNMEALDTLESDFSGTALRTQAEQANEWKQKYEEAAPLVRKAKVEDLIGKLDESLRGAVAADDFADVDPDSLNLELIQDRARSQVETRQAQKLAAAEDAGFNSVEEYETALEAVKNQRAERKEGMESISQGVSSTGGDSGGAGETSLFEVGQEGFKSAKESGATDDVALGGAIDSILAAQSVGGEGDE